MKRIILLFAAILAAVTLSAQTAIEGVVEVDELTHDFGEVFMSDGAVSHSFKIKNISKDNIAIYSVLSSCGCTKVSWTKDDIKPGATGTVSANYSNDEGPYPFDKTLTVYISDVSRPVILHLRGTSLEKARPLKELYPLHYGSIGLKEAAIRTGNLSQGEQKNGYVKIANLSSKPVKVSFKNISEGLSLSVEPSTIPAGKIADLHYNITSDREHWGSCWYLATLLVDGKEVKATGKSVPEEEIAGGEHFIRNHRTDIGAGTANIGFQAMLKENFSSLTAERKKSAPAPFLDESNFSFGRIKAGKTVHVTYTVTNKGKSPLKIYSIDSECSRLTFGKLPTVQPGGKAKIEMDFDTTGLLKGEVTVVVNMTTNSPARPLVNGYIVGFIN
jgi:hypothetical protein